MKNAKHFLSASILVVGMALSSFSHASVVMIDDFSDIQSVTDFGVTQDSTSKTLSNVNGTSLVNVSRTFIAKASNRISAIESIETKENSLSISNNSTSTGIASIQWDFEPFDFTGYANEMSLAVLYIDQNPNISVSVEMVVNGVSRSGLKTFSKTGDISFAFNDFTNSAVFAEVNSLRLNFSGTQAWDAIFRFSAMAAPQGGLTAVPLPTSLVLMGSVLLGFIGVSRKSVSCS